MTISYEALHRRWECVQQLQSAAKKTLSSGTIKALAPRNASKLWYKAALKAASAEAATRNRPSVPEVMAMLQDMHVASGDQAFAEAVNAIKKHGFDRANAGTWKNAQEKIFGETRTCVARMEWLIERKKVPSVRQAAAQVAVEYSIAGASFNAVVKRLEGAYRRRKPNGRIVASAASLAWKQNHLPKK